MEEKNTIPLSALVLGIGGLVPFVALALTSLADAPVPRSWSLSAFVVYAATILAFLGGIRWGGAVNLVKSRRRELVISVLPSLWAAGSLLLPAWSHSLVALFIGFLAVGLADWRLPSPAMPPWMPPLRSALTIAVSVCFVAMGLVVFVRV